MRKTICILAFSHIARDARVLRQIKYLSPSYDLTIIGYAPPPEAYAESAHIRWIQLTEPERAVPRFMKALVDRDYKNILFWKRIFNMVNHQINKILLEVGNHLPQSSEIWYKRQPHYREAEKKALSTRCHAYHANDWNTLQIAASAARKNKAALVLDLHEYAPLEYEEDPRWNVQKRFITYVLNKYSPNVAVSITVAAPIAERYRKEFGLDPIVIMNAPEKENQFPQRAINLPIKLIHHGAASSIRYPELMIETIALCDERYNLHFMFLHNEYVDELKILAKKLAPGRVCFHNPVSPGDIVHKISEFDVGFYILPPTNYNNLVALPNKFLDFICAGLAVCIGPSPSMAQIVKEYGFGVVCDTFDPKDMASLLNKVSSEEWKKMKQSARIASNELNAEKEMKKLVNIYDGLL